MQQRKTNAVILIFFMIFNLFLPYIEPVFAAGSTELGISTNTDGKGLLGKEEAININLENKSFTSSDDWQGAYNIGIEVTLDDGLEIVSPNPYQVELLQGDDAGKQRIFWKDVKDLKLGEKFNFPITVRILDTYRQFDEEIDPTIDENDTNETVAVKFGDNLGGNIKVYASSDARNYNSTTPTITDEFNINVVPFEISVSGGGKHVKGAGANSSDGNWEEFEYQIEVTKGEGYTVDLNLNNEVEGSLEAKKFFPAPTSSSLIEDNKRMQSWSVNMGSTDEFSSISIKAAIFNNTMESNAENTGTLISDGTEIRNILKYTATVDGVPYGSESSINYYVTAKDIVISKSSSGPVKYNKEIEHTLTIKTNEYYDVNNVIVEDIIEDGQTFYSYTQTPAQVQSKTENPTKNNGRTTLTWDLGTISAKTTVTLKYKTTVDTDWTYEYSRGPIFAGDTISNSCTVEGDVHYQAEKVTDSAGTSLKAHEPSISEKIIKVNGNSVDLTEADVTVGDTATYKITYDASGLGVKQHNVEIVDFLPEGTELLSNLPDITLNGKVPTYNTTDHYLLWELGDLPEDVGSIFTEVKVGVKNDPVVLSDKGEQNLVKLSYENSPRQVGSKNATVKLNYIEPELTITKSASLTTNLKGGDTVEFTIQVENTGSSSAYDVLVEDILADELESPQYISSTSDKATVESAIGAKPIKFLINNISSGQTVEIKYQASVIDPIGASRQFNNTVSINKYFGNTFDKTERREYIENMPSDSVNLNAAGIILDKVVYEPADTSNLRIGDEVTYKITLTVPNNTMAFNGYIEEYIPDNQSLVNVYNSDPDGAPIDSANITDLNGNDKKIVTGNLAAGIHIYYVKTRIDNISSGNSETQSNDATFFWNDKAADGVQHNTSDDPVPVTVKKPQLQVELTPAEVTIVKGDKINFKVTIENIGLNAAYNFQPYVTVPDGFEISDISNEGTLTDNIITFPQVNRLDHEGSDTLTYTFTAILNELKSAGSQYQFVANTGNYYTTETSEGEQASVLEQSNVKIQKITISQKIIKHSNGYERINPEDPVNPDFIRPGDSITYEITATVPQGTVAYDLGINDVLPNHFEPVSSNIVFDKGDQDASDGDIVITETVQARAKTVINYGPSRQETNEASVVWNKTDGDYGTSVTVNAVDVSIFVKEPKLSIGTISATPGTEFNNAIQEITITVPVSNNRGTPAYDGDFSVALPAEFKVAGVDGPAGATFTDNSIQWTNVTIDSHSTESFQFRIILREDGSAGAGISNLLVAFNINSYSSRDDSEGEERKVYNALITESKNLSIAPVTVTKTIIGTTSPSWNDGAGYVRPGDTIDYQINIEVPTKTTAYSLKVTDYLGNEQQLISENIPDTAIELKEGTHIYDVQAKVVTDAAYNQVSYTFSNTASVDWPANPNGSPIESTVQKTVRQPGLSNDSSAIPSELDTPDGVSTIQIKISNSGDTIAYNPDVEAGPIPDDITIKCINNAGQQQDNKIIWSNLSDIAGLSNVAVTFDIEQNSYTQANTTVEIPTKLASYASTEDSGAKIYEEVPAIVKISFKGNHQLSAASPDNACLIVGETAVFDHTLTNTGAGKDSYIITTNAGYPSVLLDESDNELARDDDGDGEWDNGQYTVELAREESKIFKLEVTPAMSTPKGDSVAKVLTAISQSDNSQTASVTDTVTIIGVDYNGVTFDGITEPQNDVNWQADWQESTVGAGSVLKLTALTSYDITSVVARVKTVGGGYIANTDTTPVELSKTTDGKWETNYTLSKSIPNGEYYVEYEAYNDTTVPQLQDKDTEASPVKSNNTFQVDEPKLNISISPGERTVVSDEKVQFTITIDNYNGKTDAYQFVPYVVLPEGVSFKEAEGDYSLAGRILKFFSGPTVADEIYDHEPFDLTVANSVYRSFTLETLDLSADELLNISASTGSYYTAKDPLGDKKAAQTTAAVLRTDTVIFNKAVESSTNVGKDYVRPGDQIVYKLDIDIPDGLQVKNVAIDEQVNDKLIIKKILIGTQEEIIDARDWTKTFVVLDTDTTIYVYAEVKDDITLGSFITENTATISWESNYRSYSDTITQTVQIPGKKPSVVIESFTSDKNDFMTPQDQIKFNSTISSNGTSSAYMTKIVAHLLYSMEVVAGTYNDGIYDPENNTITWEIAELPENTTRDISFTVRNKANTPISVSGDVVIEVAEYYSTLNEEFTTVYNGGGESLPIGIQGDYALSGAATIESKAGKVVVFNHTLTNNGGGQDTFNMSIETPFPVVLKSDDEVLGQDLDIDGSWDNGNVQICLAAGEQKNLKIEVTIPESTPKTAENIFKIVKLIADGQLIKKTQNAQNKIKVIGEKLDGWVDNGLWQDWDYANYRENWQEETYYPYAPMKLSAITSVDITDVKAIITILDEAGEVSTSFDEVVLTAINEDHDVEDGYTLWQNVNYLLPADLAKGRYFVEFKAKSESDATPTELREKRGFNNFFTLQDKIDLVGTVSDRETGEEVINASVKLLDLKGNVVKETTTDGCGDYRFNNIPIKNYQLAINHPLYSDYKRVISTLPKEPSATEVRVDAQLIDFIIDLSANPTTIVGDGIETTVLTTTIKDKDGNPLSGVKVIFEAEIGTFMDDHQAVTDSNGEAKILYRSVKIEGIVSKRTPVKAIVDDPIRNLHAEDQIIITFAPGAIKGVVLENNTGKAVENAKVLVYKDFDGDGIVDFSTTYITGFDGAYKVAIPKGNVTYEIEITKPVLVNNEAREMTFKQKANAEEINGTDTEEYNSENTLTGVIFEKQSDASNQLMDSNSYRALNIKQIHNNGNETEEIVEGGLTGIIDPDTGIFQVESLQSGQNFQFAVTRNIPDTNEEIVLGTIDVTIDENGQMKIAEILIDPYGTITDKAGNVIENVVCELYYADTPRNTAKGITPGTLVPLPLLGDLADPPEEPFPPNNNKNPQYSDEFGKYAWMVFPNTDYFIKAKKPGYKTYESQNISVGLDIVKHDIVMSLEDSDGDSHSPVVSEQTIGDKDLAVTITATKKKYEEGSIINCKIDYKNKSNVDITAVKLQVSIPQYIDIVDAHHGKIEGGQIVWNLGSFAAQERGSRSITFKAQNIPKAEVAVLSRVDIISKDKLINLIDDKSTLEILIFSNRYGKGVHKRYIVGYPDGKFKPDRYITRAEIAAIFARILDLRNLVEKEVVYSDVSLNHWATAPIEAVTKRGLLGGYGDGTFRPDQPITRAELSSVIARYLELPDRDPMDKHFSDIQGHWAINQIEEIYRNGIIKGYPDGTFKPNGSMKRTEAVTMINRLLFRGPLLNDVPTFPDMPKEHWAFGEVEESTHSHEFMRNSDGSEKLERLIDDEINI